MIIKCTDCNKGLEQIQFVHRMRLEETRNDFFIRDPLCKPCWEADCKEVERTIK